MVVFGFSHAHVGALLAERWDFPPQFGEAIGYHHDAEAAPKYKKLACITALANEVMTFLGVGFEKCAPMALQEQPAAKELGLDLPAIDALVAETHETLQQTLETLNF